jgi:Peptidase family M23
MKPKRKDRGVERAGSTQQSRANHLVVRQFSSSHAQKHAPGENYLSSRASSRSCCEKVVLKVAFPLQGIYRSPNTPGSRVPSHGTSNFGEAYAVDFVMVQEDDVLKKSYRKSFFEYLFKGLSLDDFYGWGQTVYSPVAGEVVEVEDTIEERNPVNIFKDIKNTIKVTKDYLKNRVSTKALTGNYVMIKVNDHVYALLAHLKKNSIKVEVGQRIKEHEVIGQLGHSGNSTMPHLHMQFMNSQVYEVAEGLPFVFDTYEIKKGKKWVRIVDSVPTQHDVVRFFQD